MNEKTITRVAFLQNYEGMPEKLLDELEEVAGKGYSTICISGLDEMSSLRPMCEKARDLGLEVEVFTGYMKYDYRYLAERPEQRMTFAEDAENDQDGLSSATWGCPFNADFKARYFDNLRQFADLPAVAQIHLNDEAYLASGCYCPGCRAAYADEIGGPMPCKPSPTLADWEDARWRQYVAWRMRRWNDVHREMAEVIRTINPEIRVCFQTSPAVDLWMNPWFSAVDLAAMAEDMDVISTDPYYTFHEKIFEPAEVYLSEWSRFLVGIMPQGKQAELIPQGFSHPTFTRPLGPEDGLWSSIVPLACGATMISPYTYTLQRISPVLEAYEDAFRLDPLFAKAEPLNYAAVVHGLKSEVFKFPLPRDTPNSYDGTRLFPVSAALRHGGVPYGYLPDAKLKDRDALASFDLLVLPEIACMTADEREGIAAHIRGGGNAIVLGELGTANETGDPMPQSLMDELFDIETDGGAWSMQYFRMDPGHPALAEVQIPDEEAMRRYAHGANRPLFALSLARDAACPSDARVIARFCDEDGATIDKPAIIESTRYGGRVLWFAGFPTRTTQSRRFGTGVINLAHQLFARLAEQTATTKPALRVEGWPPAVPMRTLRPIDQRSMPTFEFFPLAGDDSFVGVVTSYFKEPTSFPMVLDVPEGKRVTGVREALSGDAVPFIERQGEARIVVETTFDTAALVYVFDLGANR